MVTTTTPTEKSKKKHIKKLEDFTNAKDWDKFKCQEFLYYKDYEDEFIDDATHIRFNLSFFIGGLLEKFTANFIDQIIDRTVPNGEPTEPFAGDVMRPSKIPTRRPMPKMNYAFVPRIKNGRGILPRI